MDNKGSSQTLPLIILILGALTISGCSKGGSIPTHNPIAPTSTFEPTPTPEVLTATGLAPQEHVDRYGIPAVIVPFDYPVPDGMIEDPAEIQAMIEAKIAHLEGINRRFWGDAPGNSEQRQEVFEELWGILDDHYVAFNRLDIDWDAFYEENVEAIGKADSYGEYAYVITNMAYVLQEAHTFALPGKVIAARDQSRVYAPKTRYVPWFESSGHDSLLGGCYAVTSEGELVFYLVQEDPRNPYHLQFGDEFVGFNGVSWRGWSRAGAVSEDGSDHRRYRSAGHGHGRCGSHGI